MTTDPFAPISGAASSSLKKKTGGDWTPIVPVPADAPAPPSRHPQLGTATVTYTYRAADGQVNGYVLRFEGPAGKEFRPLTYCRHDRGVRDWRWLTWREPRPLYRINELHKRPDAPVLVTEGEKACHAADVLAPDYVCISSPNGSKAAGKADWTPLRGRNVTIWPDADDPGKQYGAAVAKRCKEAGAASVAIVALPAEAPEGWDAADALADGWDEGRAADLIAAATSASNTKKSRKADDDDEGGGGGGRGRRAQRDDLLDCASDVDLWHDDDDRAYVTYPFEGHREHAAVRSARFRHWLTLRYLDDHQASPSRTGIDECLGVLEAQAILRGPRYTAYIRMAERNGRIYVDMCDAAWRAIECSKDGWRIIDDPPVRFIRRDGMLSMPVPERGKGGRSGIEELRAFFPNLVGPHFALVIGWLMACFKDTGVYPILAIYGESGSGKTLLTKLLMGLIDPRADESTPVQKDDRTLISFARQSYLVGYENISHIPSWFSDALCRLASGETYASVQLYTDSDLAIQKAKRPVIMNGIPRFVEREDLATRVFGVVLPPMTDNRKDEDELKAEWEVVRPRILGALLDGVCAGLRNVAGVYLPAKPRLIGALKWAQAAEMAFDFEDGTVFQAYQESAADTVEATYEADMVAIALTKFVRSEGNDWVGAPTALFDALNMAATEAQRKHKTWPATPAALTNRIDRAAPVLRSQGVTVERGRSNDGRWVKVTWHEKGKLK